ncbi:K(+) efflux antiporter 3, chloroplastic isoform X2 [Physcomitrium patens]|uniref:RCK N-terminal domain-containing protein n=1 Tax=Physcomitrium patens TaxID=3218 RepID=A0A7I4CIB2_PHYPA|nr:K(+) efflux antiporter 3, chloroplastic-like isoform X2 [Physcomitrium patens]|eukprot:XP_024364445.1 K(+) efflux antiporter 3, chloroplastic-like isoform X2 [Physcomitrella patens]
MAVCATLTAGVPHMDYRSVSCGRVHPDFSRVLDSCYLLRVTALRTNASRSPLRRSGGTNAIIQHTLTIPALSLKLQSRKIRNQLLRSSASLGGGNLAKLVWLQSHPTRSPSRKKLVVKAQVTELASGLDVINNLGLDTLTFLGATVLIVPAFKAIKQSPILGFLLAGVVLNQLELIRSVTDVKALAELGILFLLFEMGLELSLARLKALAKFAFGIGLAQVVLSTLAFTAFELPPNKAIGTQILEFLFHARPDLVNIRTVDEAVVIGAALSLSSSAFVLQLLAEKGELPTRFGSATLGILLLQDIAVVPLLVILPILETGNIADSNLWPVLASESLKALLGLGLISLGGRIFLRRLFEIVANSRSAEAFVAMCLLTVTGTSLLTQKLGFSDTLGAFLAGALLAETNYRTQVEADIRPFRGLLLGLFFVTTGTSIDIQLLVREWPNVLALLGGLIAIKTAIITAIGPRVGLTLSESVRTGLLLSQGGEFAFVVFSLANRLGVLPLELNRLLIIVVVLSMALTPLLNEVGRKLAEYIEREFEDSSPTESELQGVKNFQAKEPVVIIGFGQMGQVLANFLSTPLATGLGGDAAGWPYVAFDLDPGRVKAACKLGFPVLYGDGSRPAVLQTAGIAQPKAVMVMYTGRQKSVQSVERLRQAFPQVPIYARAQDLQHLLELKHAGITDCILENAETSLQLGSVLLRGLGVMSDDVRFLRRMMRESMELRAQETVEKKEHKETDWLVPFQTKVRQTWKNRNLKDDSVTKDKELINEQAYWERNSDEKLPLLFANKKPATDVKVSATGVLNGSALSGEDGPTSSSAVAVASPSGMILEQEPQPGAADQELDSETEGLIVTVKPSDTEPTPSASPSVQPASMGMAKLKWRMRTTPESDTSNLSSEDLDERGVTLCALEEDERYERDLEEGEELEKLDITITALNREESN